jgi:8-oxo-(d)GTP phosphatase
MTDAPREAVPAAGAVVWRRAAGDPEVLLVHRPKYDDWSWPKGKREPGEHALLTAVREVTEETSVRPVLGPRLPATRYLASGRPKHVDYWSARGDGSVAAASHEVDAVAWLPVREAARRLSYAHDGSLLDGLDPVETVPLILIRHASAGSRDAWPGDDNARPLDEEGMADAALLAGLLACFAPRARVLSAPALRCTQTVRPYAASFGGSIEADDALSLHDRSGQLSRTNGGDSGLKLVSVLVAGAEPAVVCLHRENLPQVLAAACSALSAPPPVDSSLPKGGFWVVHAATGRLAALERYEPLVLDPS